MNASVLGLAWFSPDDNFSHSEKLLLANAVGDEACIGLISSVIQISSGRQVFDFVSGQKA